MPSYVNGFGTLVVTSPVPYWQEKVCPFVKCLDRMDLGAVRSSWDEYPDQRHRSKRTNSMRIRGELRKANADVSKSRKL